VFLVLTEKIPVLFIKIKRFDFIFFTVIRRLKISGANKIIKCAREFRVNMFVELEDFEFASEPLEAEYYREGAQDLIRKLVPPDLLDSTHDLVSRVRFNDMLPLIKPSALDQAPCSFSVRILCKYRQNASHFFYEMISRHLLPHKRLDVELFFSSELRLPRLSEDMLCVAEIVVQIKSTQDLEEIRRNFKQIETEIRLGVVSHYHARRILEFKGLTNDGKTAMIQEKIGSLIQSRSKDFDRGIFSQMQHFLVTCREEFKAARDYHHISRIISNLYSLRQLLNQNVEAQPQQRHIILKFFKTRLLLPKKQEPGQYVLGVLVGLNFLREHEIFDKSHLIAAIKRYIPSARLVEGSFFDDRSQNSLIQTNYIEIEKCDGADFTHEEIQILRLHLPEELKAHVEQLTHPIFMPRNEEEVLRNIMALSHQLRFVTDIPQVIISFEEQRGSELCFTVVLLRVVGPLGESAIERLSSAKTGLKIVPDRVRPLGALGRKHIKEAAVLRAYIGNSSFIRTDHSVDLYKARQSILAEMTRVFGELRDYNGGMIGKQNEVLSALKQSLGRLAEQHALLLEKFFFALTPVELRSVMDAEHLKQLFLLLLQSQKSRRRFQMKKTDWLFRQEAQRLCIVLPQVGPALKEKIFSHLKKMSLPPYQLISFSIEMRETLHMGFLLQSENVSEQKQFYDAIEQAVR